jgi:hypothetical protein
MRKVASPTPARGARRGRLAGALALAAGLWVAVSPSRVWAASYLAVFADGRILPVVGAAPSGDESLRLELEGGAFLEVPVGRVDRIVEATPLPPEEVREPQAAPACAASFSLQELPAGTPHAAEILRAARTSDLHPWLVAAVVEAESRFDVWAVSRVGARGLMQLMPSVWAPAGLANPHDVEGNLRVGCRHLRALLSRFGDLTLALAAYNAGAATVERYSGVPPYRETQGYVRTILARFCPPCAGGPCESPYNVATSGRPGDAGSAGGSAPIGGAQDHAGSR